MSHRNISLGLALGTALAIGGTALASPQAAAVATGAQPEYQFRTPLLNGMGTTSLADFRGRPTLVEFWGTR